MWLWEKWPVPLCQSSYLILLLQTYQYIFYVLKNIFIDKTCMRQESSDWKLPGHGVGSQVCSSTASPEQAAPPYAGAGLVQSRVRVRVPVPQVTEQVLQLVQSLNPPSTKMQNMNMLTSFVCQTDVLHRTIATVIRKKCKRLLTRAIQRVTLPDFRRITVAAISGVITSPWPWHCTPITSPCALVPRSPLWETHFTWSHN